VLDRAQLTLGVLRHIGAPVTADSPGYGISVLVTPSTEPPPAFPQADCAADETFQFCRASVSLLRETVDGALVLHFWGSDGSLLVEVPTTPAGATARAFYVRDTFDNPSEASCGGTIDGGLVRGTGTLRLDPSAFEDPANIHGELILRGAGTGADDIVLRF